MTPAPEFRPDTKERILDAAEKLFSEHGLAGTSLRSIITAADVNLAAIHYHYQTKEALIEAVVIRRVNPVNQDRLVLLDRAVADFAPNPVPVELILEAFVGPTVEIANNPSRGGRPFVRLMGRMFTEGAHLLPGIFQRHGGEAAVRFLAEFQRSLPGLNQQDLLWGLFLSIGVMINTLLNSDKLEFLSGGTCNLNNPKDVTRRIVDFAAAGLKASYAR